MDSIKPLTAIGLMSGSSLDGVDAALIVSDGIDIFKMGKVINRPYDIELRKDLRKAMSEYAKDPDTDFSELERRLTLFNAEVADELLDISDLYSEDVDLVGFHGQTIFHNASTNKCITLGDGDLLAHEIQIPVINRFRNSDMANGGQGAPIMPSFYDALTHKLPKPLVILNIGGISTVTWIGDFGQLVAFDAGPGNALIDDWVSKKAGSNMDFDGKMASVGTADEKIINAMMRRPYFKQNPPKTLDRNEFLTRIMENLESTSLNDGCATLTAWTAECIKVAEQFYPEMPKQYIVCGGGAHNPTMMRMIRQKLSAPVVDASNFGWNGDFLEAQGIAFLSVRSLYGLPYSFPTTTGVEMPMSGGLHHDVN
ncbi:MAG: anhydro-N-acetylmuramic acid kinase [Alphaproteobacteria bacterium]|nr:anhydro-N-acetylmuramic acid kinase [Alphaproteobacteria bacterium]